MPTLLGAVVTGWCAVTTEGRDAGLFWTSRRKIRRRRPMLGGATFSPLDACLKQVVWLSEKTPPCPGGRGRGVIKERFSACQLQRFADANRLSHDVTP
ncbi:hypothetical protein GCM10017557_33550 [Streptomyces aurantiacus]|uniref:Uncharacterized protein n=1 Tax=Streptomyces aurantiacus TaxID=47760 RepID=A0A7G1P3W8_9ACTN|nr:hypothetical protein GCM10017557_33550 [Streptomyces aurantiacus]